MPSHLSLEGSTEGEVAAQAEQVNIIAWLSHETGASVAETLASAGARRVNEHPEGYLQHWEF